MSSVQKLALIPQELVPQPKEDVPMSQLDREMQQIMDSRIIPDDIKVKLYQDRLTKYLAARDVKKKPVPVPIKTLTPPPPAAEPVKPPEEEERLPDLPISKEKVLRDMPKYAKESAKSLIDFLSANTDKIRWDNGGKLLREDDTPIIGSNIIDLIHFAIRKQKTAPPGWEIFKRLLITFDVPAFAIRGAHFASPAQRALASMSPSAGTSSPTFTTPNYQTPTPTGRKKSNQSGRGWISLYK